MRAFAVLLVALTSTLPLAAQQASTGEGAPETRVLAVEVNPNPVAVDASFSVSITFAFSDSSTVTAELPQLPPSVDTVSGPYIRPYFDDREPTVNKVRISYFFVAHSAGRAVFDPIRIEAGSKPLESVPFVVAVGLPRDGTIVIPLSARWKLPPSPLYEGQTFPLVLQISNEEGRTSVDVPRVAAANALVEPSAELEAPSSRVIGGTTLTTFAAASYEVTPQSAGSLAIPQATVSAGERTGSAAAVTVDVAPAPAGIAATSAVGHFDYRVWSERVNRPDGVELVVHERVDGEGNLRYLSLPALSPPGLIDLGSSESSSTSAGLNGYAGYREVTRRFLVASGGDVTVELPGFAWLDPGDGRVHEAAGTTVYVAAPPAAARTPTAGTAAASAGAAKAQTAAASVERGAAGSADGRHLLELETWSIVAGANNPELSTRPLEYLWLLPGPLLVMLVLAFRGKRPLLGSIVALVLLLAAAPPPRERLERLVHTAAEHYAAGRFESAAAYFARAIAIEPANGALYFDEGIALYRAEHIGPAVNAIRSAIYYRPLAARYREALDFVTAQVKIPEQVAPVPALPANLLFVAIVLLTNGAGVAAAFALLRRKGVFVILVILLLASDLGAGGLLAYASIVRSVPTAVVAERAEMKKIPVDSASHWLDLPPGMAVRVIGSSADFYLIETGYGIKGWVHGEVLLPDGRPPGSTLGK